MITVYLSTRGDVYYRCSTCDVTQFVPVELRPSPVFDHYNGIMIMSMIQHYMESHTRKQVSRETAQTQRMPVLHDSWAGNHHGG